MGGINDKYISSSSNKLRRFICHIAINANSCCDA
jgi:hypothetical protein